MRTNVRISIFMYSLVTVQFQAAIDVCVETTLLDRHSVYVPVHGNYSAWSAWGSCSVSCGPGIKKRTRTCTHPKPENGGLTCAERKLGPNTEVTSCFVKRCPGKWEHDVFKDHIFSSEVALLRRTFNI